MNIEKAAQKLADCMDYPWEFMPEQGRENMRNHVKAIFEAANSAPAEDVRTVVDEPVQIIAVAVTREDDEEGLRLEWLLQGGISELEFAGTVLFAMPEANDLCDEDGSAELHRRPQCSEVSPQCSEHLRTQARPVALPERLREVWLFLDGQSELEGCVFGEKPEGRHNFWWRKELRAALEELYPAQ